MKKKIKECSGEVVINNGKEKKTLAQVFEELNLRAYDLNVDNLDVHAVRGREGEERGESEGGREGEREKGGDKEEGRRKGGEEREGEK